MSDVNQLIIEKGIEHWPVFAGVGLMLFSMWKWIIPNSVKSSLENGGGDAVRSVVKSELHEQDQRTEEKVQEQNKDIEQKLHEQDIRLEQKIKEFDETNKERLLEIIAKHEEVERVTIQNVLLKLKNESDATNNKNLRSIDDVVERTAHIERKLKMKRRQPVRTESK